MKKNIFRSKGLIIGFILAVLIGAIYTISKENANYLALKGNSNGQISYNEDIRPIINSKCIACHGGVKQSSGLSFLYREEALDTAASGLRAIVPGNAEGSELMKRITHHDPELRMPLEAKALSKDEVELFRKWINQGAKWETHWAYIPPNKDIQAPKIEKNNSWPQNEIDKFILAKLQANNLKPAPRAEKEVLLRRLYLDLTGLPPTPEEAKAFLKNQSSGAYEDLVDHLLSSPSYGERWATMWLDLARYADTKGYEKDLHRTIWKYRDWVIKAFNEDKPFDEFTVEQLAGDLLPNPTIDQLIATAFHRNSMANDEGGTDNEEFRVAAAVERVGTTFEVWQGTTMACVQCHSHPYDPIRHEEFYKFMAFFNNSEDTDLYNAQPKISTYNKKDAKEVERLLSWIRDNLKGEDADDIQSKGRFLHERKENLLYGLGYRKVEAEEYQASSKLIELLAPAQDVVWQIQDSSWVMFEDVDLSKVKEISFRCATALSGGFIDVRLDSITGRKIGQTEVTTTGQWSNWKQFSTSIPSIPEEHDIYYVFRINKDFSSHLFHLDQIYYHEKNPVKAEYNKNFKMKLKKLEAVKPITTPIMQDLPEKESRDTHVFKRGNWMTPGRKVNADVPEILGEIPSGEPQNRLGMARWLVSGDNPLTARVTVNRFWAQLFGHGIIKTMQDFGSQGDPPSHAQLLDWLAVQFVDQHDWSMKSLIKQMVMSAAYQQSSVATPVKIEKDPRNRLISRGPDSRLTAEQVRDQVLAVSGLINLKMYGPSVKPPRPDEFWRADTIGKEEYRRSLYVYGKRTSPYPMFTTFDGTSRSICTSRRIRTNTPMQALTLLNGPVFFTAAKALGNQMASMHPTDERLCLKKGYERVMFRTPSTKKLDALQILYEDTFEHYRKKNSTDSLATTDEQTARVQAFTLAANTLLNLDEFVTKN